MMQEHTNAPLHSPRFFIGFFGIRRPIIIEIIFQLVFLLILAMLIYDFCNAYSAFDCRDASRPPGIGCYPWGMTEGPLDGGSWNYMNKDIFLKSSGLMIVSLVAAIMVPFFVRSPWHALSVGVLIFLFNKYAAEWTTGLF